MRSIKSIFINLVKRCEQKIFKLDHSYNQHIIDICRPVDVKYITDLYVYRCIHRYIHRCIHRCFHRCIHRRIHKH